LVVDPDGDAITNIMLDDANIAKFFPVLEKNGAFVGAYNTSSTNIYRAKDGRYFHLHGMCNHLLRDASIHYNGFVQVTSTLRSAEKPSDFLVLFLCLI
jgi:hypothetical protein